MTRDELALAAILQRSQMWYYRRYREALRFLWTSDEEGERANLEKKKADDMFVVINGKRYRLVLED